MNTDILGRRRRTVSQPVGHGVVLTDANLCVLHALRRHYVLPTPLLFHFWNSAGSYHHFQTIMTRLFHEQKGGGPFVTRPPELNPEFEEAASMEPAWYSLSPAGLDVAEEEFPQFAKRDRLHHRAMGGCIGASFEILAREHGVEIRTLDDILADARCPADTRAAKNPLLLTVGRNDHLEPDGIFGIRMPGVGYRFYCREDDRGGESFDRDDKLQNSIKGKLEKYLDLFSQRGFDRTFGLPNPRVMFITTRPGRIDTIKAWLAGKKNADRFLFKSIKRFDTRHWRAPRMPLAELYEPWDSVAGPFDITKAA